MVHLYPFSLQQGKALRLTQKLFNLCLRQGNAVYRQAWRNGKQRAQAQHRGPVLPQLYRQGHSVGALAPPVGNPAENPGGFQSGNVPQKLIRLLRCQTQRVKQFAAFHKAGDQRGSIRRPVQAREQLQQLRPVLSIFRQGILQGNVADLPGLRFRGIGSQKSKGGFHIFAFHQMEENALRHMELLGLLSKIQGNGAGIGRYLMPENIPEPAILPLQPWLCHTFRAQDEGNRAEQTRQTVLAGRNFGLLPAELQPRHHGKIRREALRHPAEEAAGRVKAGRTLLKG